MHTTATTFERYASETEVLITKNPEKKNLLTRFRNCVESTDWDEKVLASEKWINRSCLVFISLSVLYFIQVLILK